MEACSLIEVFVKFKNLSVISKPTHRQLSPPAPPVLSSYERFELQFLNTKNYTFGYLLFQCTNC